MYFNLLIFGLRERLSRKGVVFKVRDFDGNLSKSVENSDMQVLGLRPTFLTYQIVKLFKIICLNSWMLFLHNRTNFLTPRTKFIVELQWTTKKLNGRHHRNSAFYSSELLMRAAFTRNSSYLRQTLHSIMAKKNLVHFTTNWSFVSV